MVASLRLTLSQMQGFFRLPFPRMLVSFNISGWIFFFISPMTRLLDRRPMNLRKTCCDFRNYRFWFYSPRCRSLNCRMCSSTSVGNTAYMIMEGVSPSSSDSLPEFSRAVMAEMAELFISVTNWYCRKHPEFFMITFPIAA
jgi:hypothetical protein